MHRQNCGKGDEEDLPLPLPSLRLLVPPLRLVSAAIWQTVQQKVVTDYGMLEEFITMTTEIVPGLLNQNQRAQLLLGLRARLILEHCHSEPMADLQTIQPHLDRMQILMTICGKEATNVEDGLSRSDFLEFILTLLKDPDERQHFFQDVFPLEFGPKYDRAIQTLVWQFLSRLEKLLSVPQLKEVASILSNAQSVLEECVGSVTNPQELKILLEYQKAHSQLEENEPSAFHPWREL
ncbi:TERF1-interacting nuclear factor 2-like isoform 2-T2 [Polymixia lowei]